VGKHVKRRALEEAERRLAIFLTRRRVCISSFFLIGQFDDLI
jgi:hypothetical protein